MLQNLVQNNVEQLTALIVEGLTKSICTSNLMHYQLKVNTIKEEHD